MTQFEQPSVSEKEHTRLDSRRSLQEEKEPREGVSEKMKKVARVMAFMSALAFAPGVVPESYGAQPDAQRNAVAADTEASYGFNHRPPDSTEGNIKWKVVENVEGSVEIDVTELEANPLGSFLSCYVQIPNPLKPEFSEEKAKKKLEEVGAVLGQRFAEYLETHQDKIPKEFHTRKTAEGSFEDVMLVFPGTVWANNYGDKQVPTLEWTGDRWMFSFADLKEENNCRSRFIHGHYENPEYTHGN
jgi:hypothetical protein